MLSARDGPSAPVSITAARRKNPVAARGLANQWRKLSRTGRIAGNPFNGSRRIDE